MRISNYGSNEVGEVILTVYDISMGTAKVLVPLFLGDTSKSIDVIPHSGIVIGGQEYFFSGGIKRDNHSDFVKRCGLGTPVKKINLGVSKRSWNEWNNWLQHNLDLYTCQT